MSDLTDTPKYAVEVRMLRPGDRWLGGGGDIYGPLREDDYDPTALVSPRLVILSDAPSLRIIRAVIDRRQKALDEGGDGDAVRVCDEILEAAGFPA